MKPVVVFEKAGFSYARHPVLHEVSLLLQPGEARVLQGRSGIGKSTLLRLASGLLRPTYGQVRITAQRIGFVFQEPRLLPWRTALQNVMLPLYSLGMDYSQARQRAEETLAHMGLSDFLNAVPDELSGGMKQRVSLARALAVEPELLLLDEPFTGLDPNLRTTMKIYLADFLARSGAAMIQVTHDPEDIFTKAASIMTLDGSSALLARK